MSTDALATLLVREGLVPQVRVEEAQERMVLVGGTLDTALLELGLVDERRLAEILPRAYNARGVNPAELSNIDKTVTGLFPRRLAEKHGCLPIDVSGRRLTVALAGPPDLALLDEIGFMLSVYVKPAVTTQARVAWALAAHYGVPLAPRMEALLARIAAGKATSEKPSSSSSSAADAWQTHTAHNQPAPRAPSATPATEPMQPSPPPAVRTTPPPLPGRSPAKQARIDSHSASRAALHALKAAELSPEASAGAADSAGLAPPAGEAVDIDFDDVDPGIPVRRSTPPTPPSPSATVSGLASVTGSASATSTKQNGNGNGWAVAHNVGLPAGVASAPKLEVLDGGGSLEARQINAAREAEKNAPDPDRELIERRRKERVLWTVDDAIAELALAEERDEMLDVVLRFAYRRLSTVAVFILTRDASGAATFVAWDLIDPLLDKRDIASFALPSHGTHALAQVHQMRSPFLGPLKEDDPLVRLFGRRARAVILTPILVGERFVGIVYGDAGSKSLPPSSLAELHMVVPRLAKGLGNLILRKKKELRAAASMTSSFDSDLPIVVVGTMEPTSLEEMALEENIAVSAKAPARTLPSIDIDITEIASAQIEAPGELSFGAPAVDVTEAERALALTPITSTPIVTKTVATDPVVGDPVVTESGASAPLASEPLAVVSDPAGAIVEGAKPAVVQSMPWADGKDDDEDVRLDDIALSDLDGPIRPSPQVARIELGLEREEAEDDDDDDARLDAARAALEEDEPLFEDAVLLRGLPELHERGRSARDDVDEPSPPAPASTAPSHSEAAPLDTASSASAPTESAPTESARTASAPTESAPTESAPPASAPTESAPLESAPPESAPPASAPSAPPGSAPPESAPLESAPTESAPTESAPPESAPLESAPPASAPTASAPPESAPPESAPTASAPPESPPAESAPSVPSPPSSVSTSAEHRAALVHGERTVAESPGVNAREAILIATHQGWLAHDDAALDELVGQLFRPIDKERKAAIAAVLAHGARALPSLARYFPGVMTVHPFGSMERRPEVPELSDCLACLSKLGAHLTAPILVGELSHEDRLHRWTAVWSLSFLKVPSALPRLAQRFFDPEPSIASLAIEVIDGWYRGEETFQKVLGQVRDLVRRGDSFERERAIVAVGELRDREALVALVDLLGTRPREIAEEARRALVEITKQDFGTAERRWRAWIADNADVARTRWLIDGLTSKDDDVRKGSQAELNRLTGQFFGYRWDAPRTEREPAVQQWHEWWDTQGKGRWP